MKKSEMAKFKKGYKETKFQTVSFRAEGEAIIALNYLKAKGYNLSKILRNSLVEFLRKETAN